jgi:hypothetical protein
LLLVRLLARLLAAHWPQKLAPERLARDLLRR